MEIFSEKSKHIAKLISQYQSKKIDVKAFNKNMFITLAFNHFYFNNLKEKTKQIRESQRQIFQSFFKLEATQESTEKKLIAKIKDKESKEEIEKEIRKQREDLIQKLYKQENITSYVENSYNSYIPPKNISLNLDYKIRKTDRKKLKKNE